MTELINKDNPAYILGISTMDNTHFEFIDLVNQLGAAENKAHFIELFQKFFEHTNAHFEAENQLMQQTGFPAIHEHMGEHLRVLGEMNRLSVRVKNGSTLMARSYIEEHLPEWFTLHAATMDSALAAHIKAQTQIEEQTII